MVIIPIELERKSAQTRPFRRWVNNSGMTSLVTCLPRSRGRGGGDVANYAATPLVDLMRITNFVTVHFFTILMINNVY